MKIKINVLCIKIHKNSLEVDFSNRIGTILQDRSGPQNIPHWLLPNKWKYTGRVNKKDLFVHHNLCFDDEGGTHKMKDRGEWESNKQEFNSS